MDYLLELFPVFTGRPDASLEDLLARRLAPKAARRQPRKNNRTHVISSTTRDDGTSDEVDSMIANKNVAEAIRDAPVTSSPHPVILPCPLRNPNMDNDIPAAIPVPSSGTGKKKNRSTLDVRTTEAR